MPDLDAELLERVARWCAEAGRMTAAAEIRRALAPLGWDELLAVRALLADPPPARPLGPFALADLARGAPPDAAAEREREGRYPQPLAEDEVAPPPAAPRPPAPRRPAGRGKGPGLVIRRARDAPPPAPAGPPPPPLVDELLLPEGRGVLERLVRRHGARRPALLAALAAGWRRPDGGAPEDADLSRLLDHHGLARAFARRERDELLHALRAAGGLRASAAARLGLERAALDAALERTGAAPEAERIRDARRAEVRARATLAQRVRLLLADAPRLEDLGILGEIEEDLRRRLPEHLRAVGAVGGPLLLALARSLSVTPTEAQGLVDRLGLPLAAAGGAPAARARPPMRSGPARVPGGGMRPPVRSVRPAGTRRPGAPSPGGPRSGPPRSGPSRSGPSRSGPSRSGPSRSGPPRSGPPRSGPPRSGPPRSGPPRSGPPRSGPPRSGPPRSGPPRSGPPRTGPPRSGPPRSGPPRPGAGSPRPGGRPSGSGGARSPRRGPRRP